MARSTPRILAIDVGGTRVKVLLRGQSEVRAVRSGPKMRASDMVREVRALTRGWRYDVVAMGYPGVVCHGRPATEPHNLGAGWVGFDYHKAFGHPVRIVNDAAMQAIGSYSGGRMLFLGLGTGLGVAIILNGVLESTEIGHLLYKKDRTYEDYLGKRGMHRLGHKKWRAAVKDVTERLREAFEVDYVVLGGGNARKLKQLPPHARLGDNTNAFLGAFRLWLEPNWVRLDSRTRRAGAAISKK